MIKDEEERSVRSKATGFKEALKNWYTEELIFRIMSKIRSQPSFKEIRGHNQSNAPKV